jgi:hypothetical protein
MRFNVRLKDVHQALDFIDRGSGFSVRIVCDRAFWPGAVVNPVVSELDCQPNPCFDGRDESLLRILERLTVQRC